MPACHTFSLALVAAAILAAAGCASPVSLKATGVSGANSPIAQAMQQAARATFSKQAN